METSQLFESSGQAVPSPSGQYIASLTSQYLYVQYAHSLETAFTFPLPAQTSLASSRPTETTIKWSHTSTHILLISTSLISVCCLENVERKVRITNGSAGLGRITAADMMGLERGHEQVVVVWEFGRVAIWDLQTGRAAEELGEIKLGSGLLRSSWGIRREKGKAEVLALLGRHNAQDTLTLYLPPSTTPFKTLTLPTTDAQSLCWSNSWLSILDSPLASPSPSLYILTPDGHLFRTYPSPSPTLPSELCTQDDKQSSSPLGPKSITWSSKDYLALADSTTSSMTLLSTRTFTPLHTLSLALSPPEFGHEQSLSRGSTKTWKLVAENMIPCPSETWDLGAATDVRFNASGTRLAARFEGFPSAVVLWSIPALVKRGEGGQKDVPRPFILVFCTAVKKVLWHGVRDSLVMISTEDSGISLFDAGRDDAPLAVGYESLFASEGLQGKDLGRVEAGFVSEEGLGEEEEERMRVLVNVRGKGRRGWCLVYPEGREQDFAEERMSRTLRAGGSGSGAKGEETVVGMQHEEEEVGDITEDSLYDVLTGRTPLPELGTGRMIDRDEIDEETGTGLEDTFREKNRRKEDSSEATGANANAEPAEGWDDEMF